MAIDSAIGVYFWGFLVLYGVVGGLAYAAYWLSIPFAGWVIYRRRTCAVAPGRSPEHAR